MQERIEVLREALRVAEEPRRVALLNELSQLTRQSNPREALDRATEALALARRLGDERGAIVSHLRLAAYYRYINDLTASREQLDAIEPRVTEVPDDPELQFEFHTARALHYRMRGEYPSAMEDFKRSLEYACLLDDPARQIEAMIYIGWVYGYLGDAGAQIEILGEALSKAVDMGDDGLAANSYYHIALSCLQIHDDDDALEYFQRCLEFSRRAGLEMLELSALEGIGNINLNLGRLDEALANLEEVVGRATEMGLVDVHPSFTYGLGLIHAKRSQFDDALSCFRESLRIARKIGVVTNQMNSQIAIGNVYLEMGRYREAIEHFEQVVGVEGSPVEVHQHATAYLSMADAFEGLGDSERALRSYRSYMAAKSRAEDAGIRRSIANFDMRLKINRMEREHERRSSELVEEIEKRNRELAAIALQLAQKAELIEEMRKKVSYLKNRDGAASADLAKSLLPTINKVVNSGDQWKLFEEQFTRVNPSFLQRLAERFPALTPTEMKICVLLKVNLTSKEIADILCTSVRTVEGHRRLIRKKLELPAETHLGTFLSALT